MHDRYCLTLEFAPWEPIGVGSPQPITGEVGMSIGSGFEHVYRDAIRLSSVHDYLRGEIYTTSLSKAIDTPTDNRNHSPNYFHGALVFLKNRCPQGVVSCKTLFD